MNTKVRFKSKLFLALLFIVVILDGFSIFEFTRIDAIVHGDLYGYGLQFSYEWADQYWTYSNLSISSLTIAGVLLCLLIGHILIQARTHRSVSKTICYLFLIIGTGLNVCFMYLFTRLDYFVHNDLYLYGLRFNNEWATNYWSHSDLLLASIGIAILLLFTPFMMILFDSRKTVKTSIPLVDTSVETDEVTRAIMQTIKENKPQNTKQLIMLVSENFHFADKKILDVIQELQRQGLMTLEKPSVTFPSSLGAYMTTSQALWYWTTIAIAILAVAIVFTVPENLYPLSYVRNVFGVLFILCLPGYATAKMLFPYRMPVKTSNAAFESIILIALSLGMSFALVPIVGLILRFTPFGLTTDPIVVSLLFLTTIFATIAVVREHRIKLKKLR